MMFSRLCSPLFIYRGLPRDVYFIALAKLIQGIGNFITPFMMLLMTQKLGATPAHAGMILLVLTGCMLCGNTCGGKLTDWIGHKNMLVYSEVLAAMMLLICGFLPTDPLITPCLLFAFNFGMGMAYPASNALLADLSAPRNRDAVMSLGYLAYNLGSGIGPVLAGYLFWHHTNWMFWGNGLAFCLALGIIQCGVRPSSAVHHEVHDATFTNTTETLSHQEQDVTGSTWQVLRQRPHLLIFTVCTTLLYFALNQMVIGCPMYLGYLFGEQGPVLYGQLMTFASLLVVVLTPLIIRLTRPLPPIASVIISGGCLILGYAMVLATDSMPMQYLAWAFLTAAEVLIVTKESIYLANQSPRSHRGRINGVLSMMKNLGLMPTALIIGLCIQQIGYEGMWLAVMLVSLVASMGLAGLLWQQRRS